MQHNLQKEIHLKKCQNENETLGIEMFGRCYKKTQLKAQNSKGEILPHSNVIWHVYIFKVDFWLRYRGPLLCNLIS